MNSLRKFVAIAIALFIIFVLCTAISKAQQSPNASKNLQHAQSPRNTEAVKDTVVTISVKAELAGIAELRKQLEERLKELARQEHFLLQVAQDSLKVWVKKE